MRLTWWLTMGLGVLANLASAAPNGKDLLQPNVLVPWLPVLPQNALLPADLRAIEALRDQVQVVMVVVDKGQGDENPRWLMSQTHMPVLLDMLKNLPQKPQPLDRILNQLPRKELNYRGVRVLMQTLEGKRFTPLTVFEGKILAPGNQLVARDYGRRLEYWLFSTARLRRDQLLGAHLVPVVSFEQCRLLGQRVIETTPRQCLLPDNNLLLETAQPVTLAAAKLKDFDGCLKAGLALIYTFPRRCIAAGGRVFTEPPRVFEENWNKEQLAREARLSQDNLLLAVSASVVSTTMMTTATEVTSPTVPTLPTKVSPTRITSTSQMVSPLALVSGSQPSRTVPQYNWMQLGGGT